MELLVKLNTQAEKERLSGIGRMDILTLPAHTKADLKSSFHAVLADTL